MIFRFRHSFRWQLSLLLLALVLFIGMGSLFYLRYQQQELIKINLEQQSNAITTLVAADIAKLIYLDDPDVAATVAHHIKQIPEIHTARFLNKDRQPLLNIVTNHFDPQKINAVEISTEISYEGISLGIAEFVFHSLDLSNEQRKAEDIFIALIIALFLLTLLITLYIDKSFIARLSALSKALKYAAEHRDFSKRLEIDKLDEIGRAQENFNLLTAIVEEKTRTLSYQAHHDSLTGLYNRNRLLVALEDLLQHRPQQGHHAVCYLDLDQFKIVNDTCGHIAGDELLKQLSKIVLERIKPYPAVTLGRFGGDEFLVLIKDMGKKEIENLMDMIQRVICGFQFKFMEKEFPVCASIGCVLFANESTTTGELISSADAACYLVKNEDRGSCRVYQLLDPTLEDYQQSMGWVSRLQKAMDQDEFQLYLQPIVDSADINREYHHFETLIRLESNGESISPGVFIPIAERFGVCKKIDLWVIESICEALSQNQAFLDRISTMSINLSLLTIVDQSLIPVIDQIIQSHKIPYHKICFEITETGVISQLDMTSTFIEYFRDKGVLFALDDFGSGMASFGYLSQLNVDFIKIDGSFIRDMSSNVISREMVAAMIRIGKITGKEIVAEQVEDEEVSRLLVEMGAEYMQGYFFARPAPIAEFISPSGTRTSALPLVDELVSGS